MKLLLAGLRALAIGGSEVAVPTGPWSLGSPNWWYYKWQTAGRRTCYRFFIRAQGLQVVGPAIQQLKFVPPLWAI